MNFCTGYELAQLCQLAYGPEAYKFGNQYALIRSNEKLDTTTIVWRGTADAHDVLTDVQYARVVNTNYPGMVHYGVSTEMDIAWPELKKVLPKTGKVRLAGHSLGGGLAQLNAWLFRKTQLQLTDLWLFAPMRVYDHTGAELFDNDPLVPEATVMVNNRDPVPHLPDALHYSHVGRIYWIDSKGNRHSSWPFWEAFEPHIPDHHIDNYVSIMQNLCDLKSTTLAA